MTYKTSGKDGIKIGQTRFEWGTRTYVMGVINVTPDSFSGDGVDTDCVAAKNKALQFQDLGADIIDVGGESTRPPSIYPNVKSIDVEKELSRVIPAIEAMAPELQIPISVDTYKSEVAEHAIAAGASMINDIWALQQSSSMADVVVRTGMPVILMHNQNSTHYNDLIPDVIESLVRTVDRAIKAGISPKKIIVDPGIGFGKTAAQSLEILRRLKEFRQISRPIMIGTSRKSYIGHVLNLPVNQRVNGTAATVALAIAGGADIVRVHDVKEMVGVVQMSDAIVRGNL